MRSRIIGLLGDTEATRIYAPRKRTVAFLSKVKLDHARVRMEDYHDEEGNRIRWEDAVQPHADMLYLSFPWVIFHRICKEGMTSNLWVAFAKRYPQPGDLIFCPTLPNVDQNWIAQNCAGEDLTAQIELFWGSYFMLDEHPFGTRYGQLIFGGDKKMIPPSGEDEEAQERTFKEMLERLKAGEQGRPYYECWQKLEPEEVCETLRPVRDYPGLILEDWLIKNMRGHFDNFSSYIDDYKLMLGDENGS